MLKVYGLVAALVGVTILADYYLKLASMRAAWHMASSFWVGAGLYALSAIGWVLAMQHMKLATIAIVYSALTLVMLAALGVVVFREALTTRETIGLVLALAALFLMHSTG